MSPILSKFPTPLVSTLVLTDMQYIYLRKIGLVASERVLTVFRVPITIPFELKG